MPHKPLTPGFPMHPFPTTAALYAFLSTNHLTLPGLYVKLAKKSSLIPSVTLAEATEVALCFGWIDGGGGGGIDDKWWLARYTPRRSKSIWSKKNVDTVERLIREGKMAPAGMEVVEAAKKDGRWDRAYAGPATIKVPGDLKAAFEKNHKAGEFFGGLNSTQRYSVLWRIETASVKMRVKKIEGLVQMLAEGTVPSAPGATKKKVGGDTDISKVTKAEGPTKTALTDKKEGKASAAKAVERPVRRSGLRARP